MKSSLEENHSIHPITVKSTRTNIIIQKKRLDNMWGGSIFHNCHIHLTWSLTPSLERGNPSLFDNVLSCVNDMVLNIIGLLKSNIFIK